MTNISRSCDPNSPYNPFAEDKSTDRREEARNRPKLSANIRREMEEEAASWGDCHLCYTCEHCYEASMKVGYFARTTQDYNDCPFAADILYNNGEAFGVRKTASYAFRQTEDFDALGIATPPFEDGKTIRLFDNSTDNGGGYWITRCPFYAPTRDGKKNRYNRLMADMEDHTKRLIQLGVSPDAAADNAGYILYAAIGGQARQTTGHKPKDDDGDA